ncbi:MAG: 50S ribosomal protein L4 [Oscillospiraceae bacterium]|jgi:large subunit ribosomal protein L4|nr:50S ribosomal protein L4 [Oscillospiraceae bacterium]
MLKLPVIDMSGKNVGEIELLDSVFGIKPNVVALHEMIVNYLANQRQGTKSTLTRSEVSGGGRKPWRQKGTGRARQGSIRSPQWRHGGVVFAPKPRSYSFSVNKKVRRLAMKSAFSSKAVASNIVIVKKIHSDEFKTKNFVNMFDAIGVKSKTLLILNNPNEKVIKSTSNIPKVKTTSVNILNVYDIINAEKLVFSQEAVELVQEVYS